MTLYYNCRDYDKLGVIGKGYIRLDTALSATFKGISISDCTINLASFSTFTGLFVISIPRIADVIDISQKWALSADYCTYEFANAKVKWSNIGFFDFDSGRRNVAGEVSMTWKGNVWKVIPLDLSVMVYGSGGITKLTPHENRFGVEDVSNVGISNSWSISGNDKIHTYIDKDNRLCMVTSSKMEVLGYSEFLKKMSSPVLSYDELDNFIYICDGTYGYVYGIADKSFGAGPVNITGIGYSSGTKYVSSSNTIEMPTLELITDILDMEGRGRKTITEIEIGTDTTENLEASVQYSMGIKGPFVSAGWKHVSPEGIAVVNCFGKEFKIGIRSVATDIIDIDYLRIRGYVHNFNPLEYRRIIC